MSQLQSTVRCIPVRDSGAERQIGPNIWLHASTGWRFMHVGTGKVTAEWAHTPQLHQPCLILMKGEGKENWCAEIQSPINPGQHAAYPSDLLASSSVHSAGHMCQVQSLADP
jgi:hypothetical protein